MYFWYRDQWKARECLMKIPRLRHPATKLVLSYKTRFPACYSQSHCEETMRAMQKYYMDKKGLADTPYNFVIGGDDEIYECRGFKYRADRRLTFSRYRREKLHIAYIGDWSTTEPPVEMRTMCANFANFAVETKFLAPDYELLLDKGKEYRGDPWGVFDKELKTQYEAMAEAYQAFGDLGDFGHLGEMDV